MERRDFIKTGTLAFTGMTVGNLSFAFIPDNFYTDGPYRNRVPYRKPPRRISEVVSGFLWADAGDFQDYGGWAFDTQHFGFMGSSYLIAHGAGRPVEPAKLRIPRIRPGRYRLWVRARDWFPGHAPGTFGLAFNGRTLSQAFGGSGKEGWIWEDGGVHEITSERLTIELNDRTGFFGRCSSVLLTRDPGYRPPEDMETFREERARLTGHSNERVTKPHHDVVIVGGGTAGCCAAIAAARMGARTALITDRPLLGGNSSVEIGVPMVGAGQFHRHAREGGIAEEAGRLGYARGWGNVMSRPFGDLAENEENLEIYTDLFLEGVEKDGDRRIGAALARNVLTGEPFRFPGKIFIDTSGDAWLGYHAGADYHFGREARSEYNESRAPEKADEITMSGCLRGPDKGFTRCIFLRTAKAATPKPFDPPPWIYDGMPPFEEWRKGRGEDDKMESVAKRGTWWLEHPGTVDDLNDPERARDELIRTIYTFWHMVKNEWPDRQRIANYELTYVPFTVGKRETRRLLGDYVLNQNDVMGPTRFEDAIGHSGWNLDIHHPDGIKSDESAFDFHDILPISEIPYQSLYSRNIDNLMMAGRNASVTHVAMGTTRVQGQTCVMGQAAGTAAALAVAKGTLPRGVHRDHRVALQQTLLKHDQYIPGVSNEDPDDLARKATTRAASEFQGQIANPFRDKEAIDGKDWLGLNFTRAALFPWKPGTPIQNLSLRLRSPGGGKVSVKLLDLPSRDDLPGGTVLAETTRTLPADTEGWIDFALAAEPTGEQVAIVAEADEAVQWARDDGGLDGVRRAYQSGSGWTIVDTGAMTFDVDPPLPFPQSAPRPSGDVINGIARPVFPDPFSSLHARFLHLEPEWAKGNPQPAMNCWQSGDGERLPQWIELAWDAPQTLSVVQCVFDTDLNMSLPKQRDAFPDVCVRGYRIECEVDGRWKRVAGDRLNFQRFRSHRFDPVTTHKLRLTVEYTHGAPFARVFEIRAYGKETPFAG